MDSWREKCTRRIYYATIKIVFNVYKVYNSTTNTYEVDRIEIVSANSNAKVTFNKENQTITVQIKNIKANPENPDDLLDTYEIKAKKVNEQGNGLAGAKFNITWPTGKQVKQHQMKTEILLYQVKYLY